MLSWILILLVVAAVAGLLGLGTLSGLAMSGAKILIGIVLVLFFAGSFGHCFDRIKKRPKKNALAALNRHYRD